MYEFAFQNRTNERRLIDLETVSEGLAMQIKNETGIDVTGFLISIDNYAIVHTMKKHGSERTEKPRGQIPVTKDDFLEILLYINEPNNIKYDTSYFHGKRVFFFDKMVQQKYVVILEIREVTSKQKYKSSRLVLLTMYKQKASYKIYEAL